MITCIMFWVQGGASIDSLVIREKKKEEGGRSEQLPSREALGHIEGLMRHINKPQCTNPDRRDFWQRVVCVCQSVLDIFHCVIAIDNR